MPSFRIETLGCKVNAYESECYADALKVLGYREAKAEESADICIINTCAVTNTAAQKSRKKIHQARRENPKALICVVGCLVQIDEALAEEKPDVMIGSSHKSELAVKVDEAYRTHATFRLVSDVSKGVPFENLNMQKFAHQSRAYLKIQDGCNQFCSFCTIPLARGRERSLAFEDVRKNAQILLDNGHREIVLTGIHTGRYRDGNHQLIDVLKMMKDIGVPRVRISSIEVTEVTNEIITFIQQEEQMAKHLHIPLQSGSNAVLKNMHRPYTREEYIDRLQYIRHEIPDIALGCDIIVGFPAESEQDYQDTKDTVIKAGLVYLHVFPYSLRKNTVAAAMAQQIAADVKKKRVRDLIALGEKTKDAYLKEHIGRRATVLFERKEGEYWSGHSSDYMEVRVKSEEDLHSRFVSVIMQKVRDGIVYGEVSYESQ